MTKLTAEQIAKLNPEELIAYAKALKAEERQKSMTNLKVDRKGNKITIVIEDCTKVQKDSKSGKSAIIASTGGFLELGEGLKLGLNLTKDK